ncbi:hypothetical protein LNP74_25505 [Klebsiella pneumoniae subsp. pneumoniae]|nr:hypothetical protein [Klebsiella pneumoniae subsp. pneumoniae]
MPEQLRVLWYEARKSMSPWRPKCPAPVWITPEDLERVRAELRCSPLSPPCWRGYPRRFFAFLPL